MTHKQHTRTRQKLHQSAGSCPVVVGAEKAAAVLHFGAVHPCGAETECLASLPSSVCSTLAQGVC